jgi:DNA polymerase V
MATIQTRKTIDFPIATNNSIEVVKTAVTILERIFQKWLPISKSRRHAHRTYQMPMIKLTCFHLKKMRKISSLMRSIDNTNHRYGRSTLSVASAGVQKRWNMKREYSSKIDTADFYCLPTIRA